MATKVTLKELLGTIDPEIISILDKDLRKLDLDKRPHVLDISKSSLSVSDHAHHITDFNSLYKIFISVVKSNASRVFPTIDSIPLNHFKSKQAYLVYVEQPALLMAMSFDAIQKFISKVVRDPLLINTEYGVTRTETDILNKKGVPSGDTKITEVSKLDIGHMATAGSEFFISPAEQKIASILEVLSINSSNRAILAAEEALNAVNSIQADIQYEFRKSSDKVFSSVEGLFGKVFVGVTLHTAYKNQKEFGVQELKIFNEFKAKLAIYLGKPALVNNYLNYSSSNTVVEDITQGLIAILSGKKPNLKPHTPKGASKPTKIFGNKGKVVKAAPINIKIPRLRTVSGQFYSLASLQALLDRHLQDVVSANMGNGSDRRVLNYRTGRLAGSAKVERLSASREGMITAFYSYMRNPYGTFSDGGKQQYPKSRDPKLLVSSAIREIAATQVGNRMRAVLV